MHEVVIVSDELVPPLALSSLADDGLKAERADVIEDRKRGNERRFRILNEGDRAGSLPIPLRRRQCNQDVAVHGQHRPLAMMSLSPPSGMNQPMRQQNSFDRV